MTEIVNAATIQLASGPNVGANLLEAGRLIRQQAKQGAQLVVLPENFAFMGKTDQELCEVREKPGAGPIQDFLHEQARKNGIWLVGGTLPMAGEDTHANKIRSAALLMNPDGEQVARYDKVHLFDVHLPDSDEEYNESDTIDPGEAAVVVETEFGKLGVAVCYDLRFPELFRCMLNSGVEIIAVPSAFTSVTGRAHWETLVRARAIENLAFVVAAAQGGYHVSGRETYGHSMLVDPWGTVLAQVPRGTGAASSSLDMEFLRNIRRTFPVIEHRRFNCL
ncbi:MAG: carbon-nitrogen hydrolase family protein [gamma proteobacterium symbiont of Bathyaustriella thionipta]|nr:carbon-nitrogen hydrolase family protein [gamma proteobacterium symbiont of Bathyaustriella thionipta]